MPDDSVSVMLEGKGYPELLGQLLERELPTRCAQVFNGGVPGYTTFQGRRYLEGEIAAELRVQQRCRGFERRLRAGEGFERRPFGLHQLDAVLRNRAALGEHQRDRLPLPERAPACERELRRRAVRRPGGEPRLPGRADRGKRCAVKGGEDAL